MRETTIMARMELTFIHINHLHLIFTQNFKEIRQLDSVDNIYVRIADTEDGNWAYTDAVYIVTTLTIPDLQKLLTDLQPDEIYEDWMYGKPINAPDLTNDFKVFSVWWN